MGKKDKHRPGQSRNDPIFKVVGGKAGKSKNKPREVTTKLKDVSMFGSPGGPRGGGSPMSDPEFYPKRFLIFCR